MTGRHCPFLNREDDRCADHFHVGRMQHAFDHCFSDYASCPTYAEMLDERSRLRAGLDCDVRDVPVAMTINGRRAQTTARHSRRHSVEPIRVA